MRRVCLFGVICLISVLSLLLYPSITGANAITTVFVAVAPSTLTLGNSVGVTGTISPRVPSVQVTLTYTRPDGTTVTRETITSMDSFFADVYTPDQVGNWSVVASWSGNVQYSGASSSSVSFAVVQLPSGTSSITCMTDYSSLVVGTSINITGKVLPTQTTSIILELSSDGGTSWNLLVIVTSASDGTYQYSWTPVSPASYLLRARWQGDSSHSGATSNPVSAFVHGLPPDFQLSVSPNSLSIQQGTAATVTVTIISENGFSSPVNLTATNLPSGMVISFSQNPVTTRSGETSTSTATITVSTLAAQGSYMVSVSANGGGIAKQVSLTVAITAQCIIATAAFGSAMAPEVQLLREFRDNQVQHTFAGASFMQVFNAGYYSFSPTVAKFIAKDDSMRAATRVLIYPLLDILRIGSRTYLAFDFVPEFAILVCGILTSLLIGMVYMTVPAFAFVSLSEKKLRTKKLSLIVSRYLLGLIVCSIGFFALSEVLSMPIIMMFTSSLVVLTCIAAGGLLPAVTILKMLRSLRFSP